VPTVNSHLDRATLLAVFDEDVGVGGEYLRAQVPRREAVGRDRARATAVRGRQFGSSAQVTR
jgi:hypothetical protein